MAAVPKHSDRGYKHRRGHADDDEGGDEGDNSGPVEIEVNIPNKPQVQMMSEHCSLQRKTDFSRSFFPLIAHLRSGTKQQKFDYITAAAADGIDCGYAGYWIGDGWVRGQLLRMSLQDESRKFESKGR